MASVTSLDQDMKKLRLDRYTPAAANEIRKWIEGSLGEQLAPGDLMEALKDGVALCKLVNLAVSPGVRYKASNMPFVQMENISHFLKACESSPLNLPSHDRFLTVDLYDGKDPAQVLQCIAAFSRRANVVNPRAFPTVIGAKSKAGAMSPETTGSGLGAGQSPYTPKLVSYTSSTSPKVEPSPTVTTFNPLNKAAYSGPISPTKPPSLSRGGLATGGPVSSWSSRDDESKTAPAWNIHQYGYMGGASQGNQGVAFGARRQITSATPEVPSLAEKERKLREKLEKEKREIDENEQRRKARLEADEARAREEEEWTWKEETRRLKLEEEAAQQQQAVQMSRDEQSRKDQEAGVRLSGARSRQRTISDARLNGQFLSQYRADLTKEPSATSPVSSVQTPAAAIEPIKPQPSAEVQRIAELERQLAEMKAAAREQAETSQQQDPAPPARDVGIARSNPSQPTISTASTSHEDDWASSEREHLQQAWLNHQKQDQNVSHTPSPLTRPTPAEPSLASSRPLPNPAAYQSNTTRTSRFLSSNPAPKAAQPVSYTPSEAAHSTTAEVDAENTRRAASQRATKAGGWASKSLLEREMERERERQREWEESQKATATAAKDLKEGSAPGQTWDVHQYGYIGGDSQNRGGPGLGVGGARRQIIGPRPPP